MGIGPRGYALGLLEKAAEGINRFKSQGLGNFAHAVFRGAQHIAGCLCQQLIFHFHRGLAHFCLEKPPQLGLAQIADFRQMRDGDFLPVMAADIGYRRLDFLPGRIGRRLYLVIRKKGKQMKQMPRHQKGCAAVMQQHFPQMRLQDCPQWPY